VATRSASKQQPAGFSLGAALVVLGAAILLASLFLDWWAGPFGEGGVSAWTGFELADILLAALCVLAILLALPLPRPAMLGDSVAARWIPWLGPAALVFVAVTLLNDPPSVDGLSPDVGIWLGLGGAVLLTVGGLLGRARISVEFSSGSK
jgi:hypothetical protein